MNKKGRQSSLLIVVCFVVRVCVFLRTIYLSSGDVPTSLLLILLLSFSTGEKWEHLQEQILRSSQLSVRQRETQTNVVIATY